MSVYCKENPEYLKTAIDSILNQTLLPSEFIIIKDGPLTEELDKVLEGYDDPIIRIIPLNENVGLGPALAIAVEAATNEIICRMDSDDYSDPHRFERQISFFIENNLDLLGTNAIEFMDETKVSERTMPETHEEICQFAKKRNPLIHPTIVLRKSKVLEAGNYRTYYLVEDYDLFVRMIMCGAKCYNLQETLFYVRVSRDFFNRRGGLKYYKSIRKFFRELKKKKFITTMEYFKTMFPRLVIYLAPGFVRQKFYEKKLRG